VEPSDDLSRVASLPHSIRAHHDEFQFEWINLDRKRAWNILLADLSGNAGVALHSFTEKLDLSSATGRMFYNILGSFAQLYREQLAENVRMGLQQAALEGKWVNRPKTGYDLVGGELVPNCDVPLIREVFHLHSAGLSYPQIEERTGIRYSTVGVIVQSRIYVGEVLLNGQWYPGHHEPIITSDEFDAAQRGHVPDRRRGRDLLSGRVVCGLCGKRMTLETNGEGRQMYRCGHRGRGCDQPRRTNTGLHRAAVLGMQLLGEDEELQAAIRDELTSSRRPAQKAGRRESKRPVERLKELAVGEGGFLSSTTQTGSLRNCSQKKSAGSPATQKQCRQRPLIAGRRTYSSTSAASGRRLRTPSGASLSRSSTSSSPCFPITWR
jgi:hypothetical protein